MIIETKNGILIEYMGEILFLVLYKQGTKPILRDEGLKIVDKFNLEGKQIVRRIEYRITSKGVTVIEVTLTDGVAYPIKLLPRIKGDLEVCTIENKRKGRGMDVRTNRIKRN